VVEISAVLDPTLPKDVDDQRLGIVRDVVQREQGIEDVGTI